MTATTTTTTVTIYQNMPWIEKYRPNQFDGIVLDPLNRTFFRNILQRKHFPHLLFYGPPGTGKTTTIINLINEYQDLYTKRNRESIIHLNASDERGIDIIRTQIYQFVRSKHIFEVGLKFVILDEVDYMTKNAQQALKTLLQTSPENVRFCLICNYISKIDESLQHEFVCVRFNQLPHREILSFMRNIVAQEKLEAYVDEETLHRIREMHQSDIRSMINYLQSLETWDHSSSSLSPSSSSASPSSASMTGGSPSPSSASVTFIRPMITMRVWQQFHEDFFEKTTAATGNHHTVAEVEAHLTYMSQNYNIHKRNILLEYMNYLLQHQSHLITESLLTWMERIIHASLDVPMHIILGWFLFCRGSG